jgi:hypothetical protein
VSTRVQPSTLSGVLFHTGVVAAIAILSLLFHMHLIFSKIALSFLMSIVHKLRSKRN